MSLGSNEVVVTDVELIMASNSYIAEQVLYGSLESDFPMNNQNDSLLMG